MFERRAQLEPLTLRGHIFEWGSRTFVMGIINATPDSFSGDGIGADAGAAVRKAIEFTAAGVDVIDIGGESTRPGHRPVNEEEELRRVIPAIAAVRAAVDTPISVDTFKPSVAVEAIAAGADMINCVWGAIPGIVELATRASVPLVVMHNRVNSDYDGDCVTEVISSLELAARYARGVGLAAEHIIVDPGIGFGKTPDQNVQIIARLHEFARRLPYPLLVGLSRKSFIGKITGEEVGERAFGTAAAVTLSIAAGADIVRVHDVAQMRGVIDVADAIVRVGAAHAPPRSPMPRLL
ncbi:MAG TPA: dihydropteroate synthase [Candidatus Eremiobacteraceae bacterium]|nr:dihydropteroate synthase [Candidatus Eremiobacteraceae bacterium]